MSRYYFTEDLLVRPSSDGNVFTHSAFEYVLLSDDGGLSFDSDVTSSSPHVPFNSHILSPDLQLLVSRYRVKSLTVRLTRGRHDTSLYGPLPRLGFSPYSPPPSVGLFRGAHHPAANLLNGTSISGYAANPGLSISAQFHPCAPEAASSSPNSCASDEATFAELQQALSPLLCSESPPPPASSRHTESALRDPLHSLFPSATLNNSSPNDGGRWHHSRVPSSALCTSNLKSFAAILSPCNSPAAGGIMALHLPDPPDPSRPLHDSLFPTSITPPILRAKFATLSFDLVTSRIENAVDRRAGYAVKIERLLGGIETATSSPAIVTDVESGSFSFSLLSALGYSPSDVSALSSNATWSKCRHANGGSRVHSVVPDWARRAADPIRGKGEEKQEAGSVPFGGAEGEGGSGKGREGGGRGVWVAGVKFDQEPEKWEKGGAEGADGDFYGVRYPKTNSITLGRSVDSVTVVSHLLASPFSSSSSSSFLSSNSNSTSSVSLRGYGVLAHPSAPWLTFSGPPPLSSSFLLSRLSTTPVSVPSFSATHRPTPPPSPSVVLLQSLEQPSANGEATVTLRFENRHRACGTRFRATLSLPREIEGQWGYVKTSFGGRRRQQAQSERVAAIDDHPILKFDTGGTLGLEGNLGPMSWLEVSVPLLPSFLSVSEVKPGEGNRGIHLDGCVAAFEMFQESGGSCGYRPAPSRSDFSYGPSGAYGAGILDEYLSPSRFVVLTGSAGLIMAPGPDLSMPFNVITLTSTAVAFVIGTGMGILGKKGGKKIKKDWDEMKESERRLKRGGDGGLREEESTKLSTLKRLVNLITFNRAFPPAVVVSSESGREERDDVRASESEYETDRELAVVGNVGTDEEGNVNDDSKT